VNPRESRPTTRTRYLRVPVQRPPRPIRAAWRATGAGHRPRMTGRTAERDRKTQLRPTGCPVCDRQTRGNQRPTAGRKAAVQRTSHTMWPALIGVLEPRPRFSCSFSATSIAPETIRTTSVTWNRYIYTSCTSTLALFGACGLVVTEVKVGTPRRKILSYGHHYAFGKTKFCALCNNTIFKFWLSFGSNIDISYRSVIVDFVIILMV